MSTVTNPNKVRPLMDAQASQLVSHITLGDSNSVRSRGWPHGIQWALLQHYGADTMVGSGLFSFNERDSTSSTGYTVGYSEANSGTDIRVYHPTAVNKHPMPDALRAFWDSSLDPGWGGAGINHIQPKWYTLANRTIPIGAVADGPFQHGETITGSVSGEGTFDYISDGVMYFIHTANFTTGEVITGGTSGASATSSGTPSTITPMAFVNGQEPQLVVKSSSNLVGWPNSGGGDNVAWRIWYATFADTDFAVGGTPRLWFMRAFINTVQQKAWSTTALTSFKASDQGTAGTMLNPDPMQFDYPPDYATGGTTLTFHEVGIGYYPKALFWGEYVNTDKEAGFSLSQLYDVSGTSATDAHAYLVAMGDTRIGHWLASVGHRANELTQAPKAVVWINFGVNDAGDGDTKADYKTAILGIITRMKAAWVSAGWNASNLGFVLMPSHPLATDTDEEALLVQYRAAAAEIAVSDPMVMSVDLAGITNTTELLALGAMPAYDGVGDEDHLEENSSDSDNSYSVMALRVLEAVEVAPSLGTSNRTANHIAALIAANVIN